MKNRAGEYKKNLSGELQYNYYEPKPLPPNPSIEMDEESISLLMQANKTLGILDALSTRIPDIDLFVSMYVRKEALLSSQIEGTQATLEDILDPALEDNTNRNVADVINYIKAVSYASDRMQELPLCNRLLRETHAVLMAEVRGGEKEPGEFRRSQNWIGPQGNTLKTASYIPPNPEDMQTAMSDLEKFINSEDDLDPLIKIALIHYQFETIHPFWDGNGRIGRLLIILFLWEKQLLNYPTLYISYFLKRNRIEYYDRMMEVRLKGRFEQWIQFFLKALAESAQDAIDTIDSLVALHERDYAKVQGTEKSLKTTMRVFEYIKRNPIIDIKKTSKELGLSFNTISKAVNNLMDTGILRQTQNANRNRCFAYEEYLAILRKDT
jgi:Fic family protein